MCALARSLVQNNLGEAGAMHLVEPLKVNKALTRLECAAARACSLVRPARAPVPAAARRVRTRSLGVPPRVP